MQGGVDQPGQGAPPNTGRARVRPVRRWIGRSYVMAVGIGSVAAKTGDYEVRRAARAATSSFRDGSLSRATTAVSAVLRSSAASPGSASSRRC